MAAYLIAVFPANIYVAVADVDVTGQPGGLQAWLRLPLQVLFIAWALVSTTPTPRHARRDPPSTCHPEPNHEWHHELDRSCHPASCQISAEGSDASGGSLLRAIRGGQLPPPPAAQLLGLDLVDIRHGHVEFDFHPATRFDNGQAAVLGGVLAAVLDFAVSTAVLTSVDIGTMVVTSNLNVSFIRPVHPDSGTLRCVGTLIHRGHRSAFADATLTDSAGLIHARATATCLMLTSSTQP